MPTAPTHQNPTEDTAADQFLELVLADEQLLRDEFDAIIAQEWATCPPPVRDRGTSPAADSPPRRSLRPRGRGATACRPPQHPGADGWGRERSPPDILPGSRAAPPHHQATQEEIRRAYRALMRQNHPDSRAARAASSR